MWDVCSCGEQILTSSSTVLHLIFETGPLIEHGGQRLARGETSWLTSPRDPPVSAFSALGLQVHATSPELLHEC